MPCTQTLLVVTPNSTSPGFVVTVHGSGFPANKPIELRWSYGIGAAQPIEVTTDATGSFDRQVLIFAHDFIGERQVTAGMPGSTNAFPERRQRCSSGQARDRHRHTRFSVEIRPTNRRSSCAARAPNRPTGAVAR